MADLKPTEILLSGEQIRKRGAEMAAEIRRDFPDDLHLIAEDRPPDYMIDDGTEPDPHNPPPPIDHHDENYDRAWNLWKMKALEKLQSSPGCGSAAGTRLA